MQMRFLFMLVVLHESKPALVRISPWQVGREPDMWTTDVVAERMPHRGALVYAGTERHATRLCWLGYHHLIFLCAG